MIRAILFDVDGTLVDTNDLHAAAWAEAFARFGYPIDIDRVRGQIGKGGDNLMPALLPDHVSDEQQEEIETWRSERFRTCYLPRAVPFPGVRPLFERLVADGRKIVLASSSNGAEVDFHLDLIGCRDLVHDTTSKDDADNSKPCPDIFDAALNKLAPLGPDEVLVVGDTPYDVEAAAKLGIRTIAVRCGGFSDDVLRAAGASEIYDGPQDLLRGYDSSLIVGQAQNPSGSATGPISSR
jgi:HAD superfamily hydrolase (TIGR01509 family)